MKVQPMVIALVFAVAAPAAAQKGAGGQPVLVTIKRMSLDTALKAARAAIEACRKEGVQVAIAVDDFGTGYSSLAYLKRFPIDKVKIDIAFIRDVTTNPDDAAITLAIIGMAHSLKLKVIAEGVETREQLEFLRANGCDEMQGYYLSRPLPPAELERFYRETRLEAVKAAR